MRIIRFLDDQNQVHFGQQEGQDQARILTGDPFTGLELTDKTAPITRLLAPIAPTNIFCIGLNYREHAAESNMEPPQYPVVFMKPTSTLCHPGEPIRLPACQQHGPEVDYEGELVAVIGRSARDAPESAALDYLLGYTCGNDVSARKWQLHAGAGQWVRGKSFDTFCPLGPVLVTADEIPDPQILPLKTHLNGQTVQDHTTGDMIFTVAQLISFLSQDTTLLPGTLIMTGTPQGVGFARTPPIWLQPGDEVTVEIGNIGNLTNPVAAAAS